MNAKFVISAGAAAFLLAGVAMAEEHGVEWKSLTTAKVPLDKGLAAAKQKGNPVSGKFEMEDGKLQLSTYTSTKGKYWEVIVDHKNGKIVESKEIKEGDDLKHAQEQTEAMAKAKKSLAAAVAHATAQNKGYRAVSAMPSLENGAPVAVVTLENASGTKTVSEKLN